jgi:hypothetical protein
MLRRLAEPVAVVAVAAAQIALSAPLLHNATNYDEDVYLAAVDAMRHGQTLGRDVFAAQFPGFYDLTYLVTFLTHLTVSGVRLGLLVVYASSSVGAWLVGRRYGGPLGGALTAALLVVAPPLDLFAPQVIADAPAAALSILAVGLAAVAAPWAAVAAGAVWVAALSVKLTAVTALPPLLWFARDRLRLLAAGAAVVAVAILAVHATALGDLWQSGVRYHEKARSTPAVIPHPYRQIFEQMPVRTPFPWLALAAAAAAALVALRRRRRDLWPLWLWAVLAFAFLLVHQPLHYNHLIVVPATLAVAAGATFARLVPRRTAVAAALAVVLVAAYVQQWRRVDTARASEPASNVAAAKTLARLTPSGALTVDDRPIVSFLAHRRVVGSVVDLAQLRFETGSLTQRDVIAAAAKADAVVVSRALRTKRLVLAYLRRSFVRRYSSGGVEIWVRSSASR